MNLSEVPTELLLTEVARRCHVVSMAALEVPAWALPVLREVAGHYGVSIAGLMDSSSRAACAAEARHMAMALLRHFRPERAFAEIGALWGQDYGTVMCGVRKIAGAITVCRRRKAIWEASISRLEGQGLRRSSPQAISRPNRRAAR